MVPLHPMVVHFPVALLVTTILFEALGHFRKREELRKAAVYTLVLGLVGTVAAVMTGSAQLENIELATGTEEFGAISAHMKYGYLTFLIFTAFLLVRLRAKAVLPLLAVGAAGLVAVYLTGHSGGQIAYNPNVRAALFGPAAAGTALPDNAGTAGTDAGTAGTGAGAGTPGNGTVEGTGMNGADMGVVPNGGRGRGRLELFEGLGGEGNEGPGAR